MFFEFYQIFFVSLHTNCSNSCLFQIVKSGFIVQIAIDNGPARALGAATKLQTVGEDYGDMFEVSVVRREDFDKHEPENVFQDMLQAHTGPSSRTPRGHQIPFAFLQRASGLEQVSFIIRL